MWDVRAAALARHQHEHERDVRQAWLTVAMWVMSHKPKGRLQVPKLETFISRPRTAEDVEAEAVLMAQSLGIPLRPWKVKVKARRGE